MLAKACLINSLFWEALRTTWYLFFAPSYCLPTRICASFLIPFDFGTQLRKRSQKVFSNKNLKRSKINPKRMAALPNGAKLYRNKNLSCVHGFETKNSSVSTKINILIKNATKTASHQTCWLMFVASYKNKFREYEKILRCKIRACIDLQQNATRVFSGLTVRKTGTVPI